MRAFFHREFREGAARVRGQTGLRRPAPVQLWKPANDEKREMVKILQTSKIMKIEARTKRVSPKQELSDDVHDRLHWQGKSTVENLLENEQKNPSLFDLVNAVKATSRARSEPKNVLLRKRRLLRCWLAGLFQK